MCPELFKKIIQYLTKRDDLKLLTLDFPNIKDHLEITAMNPSIKRINCLLSALIYKYNDLVFINQMCVKWNIKDYHINTLDKQLVYGLFKYEDNLFLVFKGSSNFDDFLSDIDFIQVDDTFNIPGKIHKGFYELLFKSFIYREIICDIDSFGFNKLFITGHSLGGALATVFYAFLKTCRKYDMELVNFGSPRVGDSNFCNNISGTRIINENDIVPKLLVPIFYRHIKDEFVLGKKNLLKWSVDDHAVINYLEKL